MPTGKTLDQILAELNQEAEEKTAEEKMAEGLSEETEASEDIEKSSSVPNRFRMLASVWLRVMPFNEVVSPVGQSYTSKFKFVLASSVSSPLRRLVYFSDERSTEYIFSPISISNFPFPASWCWLMMLRFLRSFLLVVLKRV